MEFCGRVPTHFAHKQKDWPLAKTTVKGKEKEETEGKETENDETKHEHKKTMKSFYDHVGLTRPRANYDNANHKLVSQTCQF